MEKSKKEITLLQWVAMDILAGKPEAIQVLLDAEICPLGLCLNSCCPFDGDCSSACWYETYDEDFRGEVLLEELEDLLLIDCKEER